MKKETKIFLACVLMLLIARIWLGNSAGVFIEIFQDFDDMLLVNYADFEEYFSRENLPGNMQLLKDMGYPLFLHFIQASGMSYVNWLSLTWFIVAIMTVIFFKVLTGVDNKKIWLAIYAYVLFQPVAFTYIGLRVYRNAVLVQFYLIVLEMLAIMFVMYFHNKNFELKKICLLNFLLGIIFTWTYYIKEDGLWLLICLLVVIILCGIKTFFATENKRNKGLKIFALMLPIVIFTVSTHCYKSVNEKYFGVYVINNRTEGELGKFCRLIYKINSAERTNEVWASTDAILKAFEESETLSKNSALKEKILHTGWCDGDIFKNPIRGDFLTWVMMAELYASGTCKTVVEQEIFLRQVNLELEQAFKEGKLQKDSKIQLVSSMGGKTSTEILNLRKLIGEIYYAHIFCPEGSYGIISAQPEYVWYAYDKAKNENLERRQKYAGKVKKVSDITNMNFSIKNNKAENATIVIKALRKIYSVINLTLFVVGIAGIILSVKNFGKEKIIFAISVGAFLLSVAYAFAISWFADFLHQGLLITYSGGIISMLIMFELAGSFLFYNFIFEKRVVG